MSLADLLFQAKPPAGVPPFAPAPMEGGGSNAPTTPDTLPVKQGLSGFLDRFLRPQNTLGQFGRALVMAGGTPLGDAYALMDRAQEQDFDNQLKRSQMEEAQRKARMPKTTQVGSSFGVVDPETGAFTPTYTAPEAPSPLARDRDYLNGVEPGLGDKYVHNRADPLMGIPGFDATGAPTMTFLPRSGAMPGAPVTRPAEQPHAPSDSAFPAFRSEFKHGRLTSGRRTEYGNRSVGGAENSNHLIGDGADYWGADLPALQAEVQAYYGPRAHVSIHRGPGSPHVHADLPGYGKVPLFGKRGTQRGPSTRSPSPPSGFVLD